MTKISIYLCEDCNVSYPTVNGLNFWPFVSNHLNVWNTTEGVARITGSMVTWIWDRWLTTVIQFQARAGDFSLLHSIRPSLGPTQPPIQWLPRFLSPGIKWLWCPTEPLTSSGAEVINAQSYTYTSLFVFTAQCFIKNGSNLTSTVLQRV